jgi:glyoxylase-like metal-dependent hydrolase (beta-lactamase superfamily II)
MNKQLYIQQLELGSMANFVYIIGDTSSGQAVVVDPHDETEAIETVAAKARLVITSVLLTHGHYDHTGGVKFYSERKKLPVYISSQEYFLYIPHCKTLKRVNDKDVLSVGGMTVQCLHTPGHTPGGISYLIEDNLFTGDTVFVDGVGRTDLPGGHAETLFNSLQAIKKMPANTMIWPGHRYGDPASDTLEHLLKKNPFLAASTFKKFSALWN